LEILKTYPLQSSWDQYFIYSLLLVATMYTSIQCVFKTNNYFLSKTQHHIIILSCWKDTMWYDLTWLSTIFVTKMHGSTNLASNIWLQSAGTCTVIIPFYQSWDVVLMTFLFGAKSIVTNRRELSRSVIVNWKMCATTTHGIIRINCCHWENNESTFNLTWVLLEPASENFSV